MKRALTILVTLLFLCISTISMAQRRHKKRGGGDFTPTEAQKMNFIEGYKRVLGDSLNIPTAKRDTVAAIELTYLLKKMKINNDKSISKDDKDVQTGMLDGDMYMHLGAVLNAEELQRLQAFEIRQKKEQDERIKAQKDAQAAQSNNTMGNRNGYYRGGYNGYGY